MNEHNAMAHILFQMCGQELLKGAFHEQYLDVNGFHIICACCDKIAYDGKSTKALDFDTLQAKSK